MNLLTAFKGVIGLFLIPEHPLFRHLNNIREYRTGKQSSFQTKRYRDYAPLRDRE
ncbi:MAG: hypothetical protein OK457_06520 [Thaumarchaeota archaeon]|nr:hypothetical protein [Nitrososphaerota archaeon]